MIENFTSFFCAFFFLILYFLMQGDLKLSAVAFSIIPTLLLFIAVTSFSITFAVLNVRYRDLKFILSFIFSALYFITPIFYSISIVSDHYQKIFAKNPFYILIRPFQELLVMGPTNLFYHYLLNSFFVTCLLVLLASATWNYMKRNISYYA